MTINNNNNNKSLFHKIKTHISYVTKIDGKKQATLHELRLMK